MQEITRKLLMWMVVAGIRYLGMQEKEVGNYKLYIHGGALKTLQNFRISEHKTKI